MSSSHKDPTHVYFIKPKGMAGPVKIGCSRVPNGRLVDLTVWSPFELELIGSFPGTYSDEQFIHSCFAHIHSHREWFYFTPELGAAIKSMLDANSVASLRGAATPSGGIRRKGVRQPNSPERTRFLSYAARVRCAEAKLRKAGENTAWCAPSYIDEIISHWSRDTQPSAYEVSRLDQYLSAPAAYSVVPWWARNSARSAA